MKIVFLTVHDATSQRKVDFHFWADVITNRNIDLDFVTVGFSLITFLKKGGRVYNPPFNIWVRVSTHKRKFLWCAPFHPFGLNNNFLNKMMSGVFSQYAKLIPRSLLKGIQDVDIFIVENGAGLTLIPDLAKKFPKAKFVYSVCDRIETLGYHPVILSAEKSALKYIDLIRVPAQVMVEDYPNAPNIHYIPHGLDKKLFDGEKNSPYEKGKNVVSVGDMLFDGNTIHRMAEAFPGWTFHLFGKNAYLAHSLSNVISYGEKPFADIIPYIQHADIGLAPYKAAPNADYLSQSSMKMIQYTYCRLPIIAPKFAAAGRAHILSYDENDSASVVQAMENAIKFDRSTIDNSAIMNWDKTVDAMFTYLEKTTSS